MEIYPIEYDKYGKMFYNPEFHANNGKPWTKVDIEAYEEKLFLGE